MNQSKSFIIYPRTKIDTEDPRLQVIDAPIKVKLKAFISAYLQDYSEMPTTQYIQSIFGISELDAEMAIHLYGNSD
ncbi:hypothetical protein MHB65_22240 [Lysinibacillus sp. FSL K6-0075]|uniref:hypothetical protein n=1 Tax=Lysinibacillus sp. FSL K6-0075 TaxID=2921415 RepID=UPI003158DC69